MNGGDAASPASGEVRLRCDAGIAWITLDRPERLNALAGDMRDRLADAVEAASDAPAVRVIVVTGAGRAFCAGADIDVMSYLLEREDDATFGGYVEAGARAVRSIRAARQPVIAAVNGVAAGAGASLAIACDVRIASGTAQIGFTFNRIGLHPDWGASHFLPRLVGSGRAAELVYSGRMVRSDEAERLGLFERVVPAEAFAREVEALAAELAAKPPLALALARRSLAGSAEHAALEEALRQETAAQMECFRSRDVREGIAAFREKRPAHFRGA